jgi:multidrug efflux pump subunit AcrB
VPIGFAKSSAGEYTFSIFSVVAIALIVSGWSRWSSPRCSARRC